MRLYELAERYYQDPAILRIRRRDFFTMDWCWNRYNRAYLRQRKSALLARLTKRNIFIKLADRMLASTAALIQKPTAVDSVMEQGDLRSVAKAQEEARKGDAAAAAEAEPTPAAGGEAAAGGETPAQAGIGEVGIFIENRRTLSTR